MAFQDFDLIQERRRAERSREIKKRITMAILVICILLVLISAAFAYLVVVKKYVVPNDPNNDHWDEKNHSNKRENNNNHEEKEDENGNNSDAKSSESTPPTTNATLNDIPNLGKAAAAAAAAAKDGADPEKVIKAMCSTTDYKKTCESTLAEAAQNNKTLLSSPAELLRASMDKTSKELDKVIQSTSQIQTQDPMKKAAIDDCMVLLNDAKYELNSSMYSSPSSSNDEINNWLSAVMSYQQTCIDGIPDGEEKNIAQKSLQVTKELTSNSLAMVTEIASFIGEKRHRRRSLLSASSWKDVSCSSFLPSWMDDERRRALKARGSAAKKLTPNAIVAKDGTGNFTAISAALASIPQDRKGRYVIYVKPGIYEENVIVTKQMVNVTIYGDGSQKSIITGSKNYVDGIPTFQTATFVAMGEGFMAMSMGFRNTAGPTKNQAVAIRVQSDRSIFINCRMEGYQATLFAQTHRQFYRSCYIMGTIDFIFGDAAVVFQNCIINIRKPVENQQNTITSQGRVDKREMTGIVLQNCRIIADSTLEPEKSRFKSYLGRPSGEFSRTIVMESEIEDVIQPEGWIPFGGDFALKTLYYGEYNNKGSGAQVVSRVKWPGFRILKRADAIKFTVSPFLGGDIWLKGKDIPLHLGLFT